MATKKSLDQLALLSDYTNKNSESLLRIVTELNKFVTTSSKWNFDQKIVIKNHLSPIMKAIDDMTNEMKDISTYITDELKKVTDDNKKISKKPNAKRKK